MRKRAQAGIDGFEMLRAAVSLVGVPETSSALFIEELLGWGIAYSTFDNWTQAEVSQWVGNNVVLEDGTFYWDIVGSFPLERTAQAESWTVAWVAVDDSGAYEAPIPTGRGEYKDTFGGGKASPDAPREMNGMNPGEVLTFQGWVAGTVEMTAIGYTSNMVADGYHVTFLWDERVIKAQVAYPGFSQKSAMNSDGEYEAGDPCWLCGGSGTFRDKTCTNCNGTGVMNQEMADSFNAEGEQETFEESRSSKVATIVKKDDGYYVESEEGKNLGGPYESEEGAKDRLQEVEYFKHKEGQTEGLFTHEVMSRLGHGAQSQPATAYVSEVLYGVKQRTVYPCVVIFVGMDSMTVVLTAQGVKQEFDKNDMDTSFVLQGSEGKVQRAKTPKTAAVEDYVGQRVMATQFIEGDEILFPGVLEAVHMPTVTVRFDDGTVSEEVPFMFVWSEDGKLLSKIAQVLEQYSAHVYFRPMVQDNGVPSMNDEDAEKFDFEVNGQASSPRAFANTVLSHAWDIKMQSGKYVTVEEIVIWKTADGSYDDVLVGGQKWIFRESDINSVGRIAQTNASCTACGKEMRPNNTGCFPLAFRADESHAVRITYGGNGEDTSAAGGCPDCNCAVGTPHHDGCDLETCPDCGGQFAFCECFGGLGGRLVSGKNAQINWVQLTHAQEAENHVRDFFYNHSGVVSDSDWAAFKTADDGFDASTKQSVLDSLIADDYIRHESNAYHWDMMKTSQFLADPEADAYDWEEENELLHSPELDEEVCLNCKGTGIDPYDITQPCPYCYNVEVTAQLEVWEVEFMEPKPSIMAISLEDAIQKALGKPNVSIIAPNGSHPVAFDESGRIQSWNTDLDAIVRPFLGKTSQKKTARFEPGQRFEVVKDGGELRAWVGWTPQITRLAVGDVLEFVRYGKGIGSDPVIEADFRRVSDGAVGSFEPSTWGMVDMSFLKSAQTIEGDQVHYEEDPEDVTTTEEDDVEGMKMAQSYDSYVTMIDGDPGVLPPVCETCTEESLTDDPMWQCPFDHSLSACEENAKMLHYDDWDD